MDLFIYLIFLSFLIFIIVLNKLEDKFLRILNYIFAFLCFLVLFLSGTYILFTYYIANTGANSPFSLSVSILLILASLVILLLLHEKFAQKVIKILRINIDLKNPRHYFAFLLFLFVLFAAAISFVWTSEMGKTLLGTEISDKFTNKFTILDVVINEIFYLAIAIFGYGYLTRKNFSETSRGLGLKKPTFSNILFGFSAGIGLIFIVIILSLLFQHFGLEEENMDWIKNLISVQNAFILGLSAGICEEILFRGALQPKFGIVLTALLFAFLHIQYPALWMLFVIFVIGLILGYVRKITNTTTAIIVHSTYDVVQMLMLYFAAM